MLVALCVATYRRQAHNEMRDRMCSCGNEYIMCRRGTHPHSPMDKHRLVTRMRVSHLIANEQTLQGQRPFNVNYIYMYIY